MEKEGRMTCHVLLKLGASRKEEGKKPRQNHRAPTCSWERGTGTTQISLWMD